MNLTMNARRESLAKILAALVLAAGVFVTGASAAQAKHGADDPPGHERHHHHHHHHHR
jgi:hypothetical protein